MLITRYIQIIKGFEPKRIEESKFLRFIIGFTVSIGILAATHISENPGIVSISSILIAAIGNWVSWRRRHSKRNWPLKVFLSIFMLMALGNFFVEIAGNPYHARIPLMTLLIYLQVLHSFDLPRRKDLFYSLWVALILISVAATISREFFFGIYFILFVISSLLSLFFIHLSSQQTKIISPKLSLRILTPLNLIICFFIVFIFIFMPRYEGMKIRSLPMSFKIRSIPTFKGEIKNPAYPNADKSNSDSDQNKKNKKNKFDPYSYYGFSTTLNLNYRGKLSDEIVMRVKSSKASYWRGLAFDKYNGQNWEMTHPYKLRRLSGARMPIYVRQTLHLKKNIVPREEVIQTFYIEKDQSNLVFIAPYAEYLYFPTDYVLRDEYGGLRSPIELFKGTVYSVISQVPVFDVQSLRQSPPISKLDPFDPIYLQIPESLPARVKELARELTKENNNHFDAVKSIENHLREKYPYDLDIPEFPEKEDTIDYFLFEQKAGYCEHFATSLAIMARSLGIPSRLVTGYGAGEYNPLTRYFEVKSNDAHAWVEVFFPHHGWVPFDPTPGFNAYLGHHNTYKENTNKQFLNYFFSVIPQGWKNFIQLSLKSLVENMMAVFYYMAFAFSLFTLQFWLALIIGASIVTALIFRRQTRNFDSAQQSSNLFIPDFLNVPSKADFINQYHQLLQLLSSHLDIQPEPSLTVLEHITIIVKQLPQFESDLRILTQYYYCIRYSSKIISLSDQNKYEKILMQIQQKCQALLEQKRTQQSNPDLISS